MTENNTLRQLFSWTSSFDDFENFCAPGKKQYVLTDHVISIFLKTVFNREQIG